MSIAENLLEVRGRIAAAAARAGRNASEVTLVAVSKTVPAAVVRQGLALGLTDLGENRVQEALAKQAELGRESAVWHLIGSLQTNKARKAVENFDLIHSLDREDLAAALDKAGRALDRRVRVLIQVNVSGEQTKHGLAPAQLPSFLDRIGTMEYLEPCGLMTMAPLSANQEQARPVFSRLRELFDAAARTYPSSAWRWLSMGMSQDYEAAVEEGANLVRIGTAVFGGRSISK